MTEAAVVALGGRQRGAPPAGAVLCYVSDPWCFFTTAPLAEVYGDDWNDAPYEHNAGEPYSDRWPLWIVAAETPLATPRIGHLNSPYSVEQINQGAVPWLSPEFHWDPKVSIYAGCTYAAFVELIGASGGRVFEDSLSPRRRYFVRELRWGQEQDGSYLLHIVGGPVNDDDVSPSTLIETPDG